MKKLGSYIIPEKSSSSIQEPAVSYPQENPVVEAYPIMPLEEALKRGMTLEESKQRIMKKICKHFHPDESYC